MVGKVQKSQTQLTVKTEFRVIWFPPRGTAIGPFPKFIWFCYENNYEKMKRVYFLSHEFKLSISGKIEKSLSGHGLCRCDFVMAINCLLKSTCLADYLVILILKEDCRAKFNVYFYCKKRPLTTKRKRNWPQKVFTAHFRLHYYNDYKIIMINRRKLQLLLDSYRRCFFSDFQSWFYTFCISWHWPVILSCLTETARNRIESTYQEEKYQIPRSK